jgi:hypothetical protein
VRQLDERLAFSELTEQHLTDSRCGKNTPLPLADLLRQSVYSRLAGYGDVNSVEIFMEKGEAKRYGQRVKPFKNVTFRCSCSLTPAGV